MAASIRKNHEDMEAVIRVLASKHGVSFETARAIFSAGVEAGRLDDHRPASSESRGEEGVDGGDGFSFSAGVSLEDLRREQATFAKEREWDQFHTPRNLAFALVGEVGELCECFQVSFLNDNPACRFSLWSHLFSVSVCAVERGSL